MELGKRALRVRGDEMLERFEAAVHRLWRAGIRFRLVYGQASDAPLWSVIQENPTPGSDTPESAAVNLVISMHHELGVTLLRLENREARIQALLRKRARYRRLTGWSGS